MNESSPLADPIKKWALLVDSRAFLWMWPNRVAVL